MFQSGLFDSDNELEEIVKAEESDENRILNNILTENSDSKIKINPTNSTVIMKNINLNINMNKKENLNMSSNTIIDVHRFSENHLLGNIPEECSLEKVPGEFTKLVKRGSLFSSNSDATTHPVTGKY